MVSVGAPPENFTDVDPSDVKVAVLSVALILIINNADVPSLNAATLPKFFMKAKFLFTSNNSTLKPS